jgi:hypothetical protein
MAALEASSNLLRATQIAAETSPMVKRRTVSTDRKMSRDLSEERGGGMRRLSRDETMATTTSRRISMTTATEQQQQQLISSSSSTTVVAAVQQQQQAASSSTRQAAVSSAHLSAESAGVMNLRHRGQSWVRQTKFLCFLNHIITCLMIVRRIECYFFCNFFS